MKSATIITLLAAAISSTQVAAELTKVDKYNWAATPESENEWGRNKRTAATRRARRNLRANRNLEAVSSMSLSMSMPEIEELEFDFEDASLSMSMSM